MKNEIYDVDYFIKKFSAIPEDQWCIFMQINDGGQRCALGHCGAIKNEHGNLVAQGHTTEEGVEKLLRFM